MSVRISSIRLRGESMIDAPQWMTRLTTSYVEKKSDELGNRLVKYGGSPLYSCAKKRLHWGRGACLPGRVSGPIGWREHPAGLIGIEGAHV
jgi:hypothetical protein